MDVHVVVVPRERYSGTARRLAGLIATLPPEVTVTVVAGGMPTRERRRVAAVADAVGSAGDGGSRVEVVGPHHHLAPNSARALGLARARRRWVAFVDNDVAPDPGWLEPLVATAEAEGAWAVRPLVLSTLRSRTIVHDAGGSCHLVEHDGRIVIQEHHAHFGEPADRLPALHTSRVELFEFHTVLFDRERLVELGGPDEALLSTAEHLDLGLRLADAGGTIWLEPSSVVRYEVPERLALRDLPFFLGRWSPSWNRRTRSAFCARHGVDPTVDPCFTWGYADQHRSYAWLQAGRWASRTLRRGSAQGAARRIDDLVGARLADASLRLDPAWRHERATS